MERHETSPTLIERLRNPADAEAWQRFQSMYGDFVVRYCRAKGLQVADAEDAWQQTLVKLTRAIPSFKYDRGKGRFRDYLFVVVRSVLASSSHRGVPGVGRRMDPSKIEEGDSAGSDSGADDAWEREWRDFHFRRAWAAIAPDFDPRSLAAFECLLAGQAVRSVADRFAMSEQGLHKVKQRVRDRLTERIRAQVMEEDGGE